MFKYLMTFLLIAFTISAVAQNRYMTRTGKISFYSSTPMEDIKADNNQVAAVLDRSTGELVYNVLIKSFQFDKKLMQEHFNENYMNSDEFPRSKFIGKVRNIGDVNFDKNGEYKVTVDGNLTIKDKTHSVEVPGVIIVKDGAVETQAKFKVRPADYNIEIPGLVRDKIAKEIEVTVDVDLSPAAQ